MREITTHVVEGDKNPQLKIFVTDEPGVGGANHEYVISWSTGQAGDGYPEGDSVAISFQNGPIKEHGLNGVTHEALLAIVIDRLEHFQAGPFACEDDDFALSDCVFALDALQERTQDRLARGVEGKAQA